MTLASILVVDDNAAKRYAMARSLTAAGYQVAEAGNGAEAIERADGRDAVVLDVHLPDLHGFDVCRRLKKAHPAMPVVQVSAVFTETVHRAAGNLSGADAYLVDPGPEELLATVKAALRGRKPPALTPA